MGELGKGLYFCTATGTDNTSYQQLRKVGFHRFTGYLGSLLLHSDEFTPQLRNAFLEVFKRGYHTFESLMTDGGIILKNGEIYPGNHWDDFSPNLKSLLVEQGYLEAVLGTWRSKFQVSFDILSNVYRGKEVGIFAPNINQRSFIDTSSYCYMVNNAGKQVYLPALRSSLANQFRGLYPLYQIDRPYISSAVFAEATLRSVLPSQEEFFKKRNESTFVPPK